MPGRGTAAGRGIGHHHLPAAAGWRPAYRYVPEAVYLRKKYGRKNDSKIAYFSH
jgi:hypothetical protein